MTDFDYSKPAMIDYIALYDDMGYRLTNIKNPRVPLDERKKIIFDKIQNKLDDKPEFQERFEKLFEKKKRKEKEKTDLAVNVDLSNFKLGEIVFVYDWENDGTYVAKCRIIRVNKCSVTVQKFIHSKKWVDDGSKDLSELWNKYWDVTWSDELEAGATKCIKKQFNLIFQKGSLIYDGSINGRRVFPNWKYVKPTY